MAKPSAPIDSRHSDVPVSHWCSLSVSGTAMCISETTVLVEIDLLYHLKWPGVFCFLEGFHRG